MVDSDAVQNELQDYLKEKGINTLFINIVEGLLLAKPDNPIQHIVDHLYKNFPDQLRPIGAADASNQPAAAVAQPTTDEAEYSATDSDEDSGDEMGEMMEMPAPRRGSRRVSVSAESMDPAKLAEQQAQVESTVYPKSDAENARIREILQRNMLFKGLTASQTDTVVNAMFPAPKNAGEVIITQGEEGDNFYLVDSGVVEIYKDDLLVQTCTEAMSFGELALMYNAPRAATVKAKTQCSLWALDRMTFKLILMQSAIQRQQVNHGFLEHVPILESLTDDEMLVLGDALHPYEFNDGDVIIREGDPGDVFYIIESGTAVCTKTSSDGTQAEVARLGPGAHFGEVALLSSRPRQATVTAQGPLKTLTLDRNTFKRVMGPLEDILKRHMETYNLVMAQGI